MMVGPRLRGELAAIARTALRPPAVGPRPDATELARITAFDTDSGLVAARRAPLRSLAGRNLAPLVGAPATLVRVIFPVPAPDVCCVVPAPPTLVVTPVLAAPLALASGTFAAHALSSVAFPFPGLAAARLAGAADRHILVAGTPALAWRAV